VMPQPAARMCRPRREGKHVIDINSDFDITPDLLGGPTATRGCGG
jgi:hypothetical protein